MDGHHHNHHHNHSGSGVNGENLLIAALLNFTITVVEIAGGILSNSFALLSDAMHNFGDTIAIFLAYLSNKISKRTPTLDKTYGFKRIEIMAALINALIMIFICVFLFAEAAKRFHHPQPINGVTMVIISSIALFANFISLTFLKKDKEKNLNVKAAYTHLLVDTLSSFAVLLGGIIIFYRKIYWIDPLLTFLIGIYILKEALDILKQAYLILLQATPNNLDLVQVKASIEAFNEIDNVHHIHAWNLDDSQIHFECHIDLKENIRISETEEILFKIKTQLKNKFKIAHTTVQFEYNCCDDKSAIKIPENQ
jgi:cobalt-zinc-cadmium efflux system protein